MCGRFSLGLAHNEIQNIPGYPAVHIDDWINQDQFVPRFNVAPHTQAPVIRRKDHHDHSSFVLHTMKWGIVPHWAKHEDKNLNTTNARAENLVDGGGMWGSIKKKRCAVLCQGYYEWLKKGPKERIPHFTRHKDGKLMLLAGLYDSVVLEGKEETLWTFTIVTTTANKESSWLHDRQPVILDTQKTLNAWLEPSSQPWTPELTQLVRPYHGSPLECYQVPKEIGRVGSESSTFIEPIKQRKDGIQAMFSRQKQSQSFPETKGSIKTIKPGKRNRSASPSRTKDTLIEPNKKKRATVEELSDDDDIVCLS